MVLICNQNNHSFDLVSSCRMQNIVTSSVTIDENQLLPAHNILSMTKLKIKETKATPTTIDQNGYC